MRLRNLIILPVLFSLVSCGIFKDTQRTKTKTHRESKETGVRIVEVPKDSIVYVPKVILKKKDTTIIIENKHLVLKTTYGDKQIRKITAIQKPVKEITQYEKTVRTDEKVKQKESRGLPWREVYVLYFFVGIGFLIIINNLTKKK